MGKRASAGDLYGDVFILRQFEEHREVGKRRRRGRRFERLLEAKVIDDQQCLGILFGKLRDLFKMAPTQQVDRQRVAGGRGQNTVDGGLIGAARIAFTHHDADRHGARHCRPVGDGFGDRRVDRIDRLDQAEPPRMGGVNIDRIGGVEAVQGPRRNQ